MITIGNLGGAAAGWVTGHILRLSLEAHAASEGVAVGDLDRAGRIAGHLAGYQLNFVIFAGVYLLAVLLWLRVDATQPVAPE
jgi:hypothetical protein